MPPPWITHKIQPFWRVTHDNFCETMWTKRLSLQMRKRLKKLVLWYSISKVYYPELMRLMYVAVPYSMWYVWFTCGGKYCNISIHFYWIVCTWIWYAYRIEKAVILHGRVDFQPSCLRWSNQHHYISTMSMYKITIILKDISGGLGCYWVTP